MFRFFTTSESKDTVRTRPEPHFDTQVVAVDKNNDTVHPADLAEKFNALLPVHKIPFDVLSDILKESLPEEWGVHWWLTLSLVCRRWRYFIVATATFWTDVRTSQIDLARLCIKRSRQALITFRLVEKCFRITIKSDPLQQITLPLGMETVAWNLLKANVHRVQELRVYMDTSTFPILLPHLATLDARVLRRFEIFDLHGTTSNTPNLGPNYDLGLSFASQTAPIQHPAILELSVHASITLQLHLTSLTLHLSHADSYAPEIILETVQAFPMLELFCAKIWAPLRQILDDEMTVVLPRLRYLELQLCTAEDGVDLLEHMVVPVLEQAAFVLLLDFGHATPLEFIYIRDLLCKLPIMMLNTIKAVDFTQSNATPKMCCVRASCSLRDKEAVLSLTLPCYCSGVRQRLMEVLLNVLPNLTKGEEDVAM